MAHLQDEGRNALQSTMKIPSIVVANGRSEQGNGISLRLRSLRPRGSAHCGFWPLHLPGYGSKIRRFRNIPFPCPLNQSPFPLANYFYASGVTRSKSCGFTVKTPWNLDPDSQPHMLASLVNIFPDPCTHQRHL